MSNPRVKRPFAGAASDPSQRQITSFFQARSESPSDSDGPLRSPRLPANVESNLLSVGMRIRKSVPEGYKTVGPSAFKLWTDNTPLPTGPKSTQVSSTPPKAQRATSRELLPFCGINKVGGLDSQPDARCDTDDDLPGLDEIPGLTMSQESTDSTASTGNTRKRFISDETEDPVQVWMEDSAGDGSLASTGMGNARIMAVPKSRVQGKATQHVVDQENMAVDGDFEEAGFLVFDDVRGMDIS